MAGSDHGAWAPLSIGETASLFAKASFRWWISGGFALELHLGRSWRQHDDVDVAFCRDDAALVRTFLRNWDVHVAAAGALSSWSGQPLSEAAHQNNLWARCDAGTSWQLDLTVSHGDDDAWIFRRDPAVRLPWEEAVLRSEAGIPYLAPELQLMFKEENARPKDDLDAAEVIPHLSAARLATLRAALPAGHAWLALFR